jgi:hypothetical protein
VNVVLAVSKAQLVIEVQLLHHFSCSTAEQFTS